MFMQEPMEQCERYHDGRKRSDQGRYVVSQKVELGKTRFVQSILSLVSTEESALALTKYMKRRLLTCGSIPHD